MKITFDDNPFQQIYTQFERLEQKLDRLESKSPKVKNRSVKELADYCGVAVRVDNLIIRLDPFLIQRSPNGREFRVLRVEKDLSVKSQWINEVEKFCWIVTVKFLDDSQLVILFFNYMDNCVKKVKKLKEVFNKDELSSCRKGTLVQGPYFPYGKLQ